MNESATFTAAQIAAALRCKRQTIYRAQGAIEPTTCKAVNGQLTAAWSFAAISPMLRSRLESEAERLGYRSAEALLNKPVTVWQPRLPLSQIAQPCLDKAVKLQRVLAPFLTAAHDKLTAAEFDALGRRDYEAVFGHSITAGYFRELVTRTTQRDGGAQCWDRVEIYLDDNLTAKREALPVNTASAEFQELHTLIASFRNPVEPSRGEQANLWLRSIELLAHAPNAKRAKRRLIEFLCRYAPALGKSPNAVRVNLDRKFKLWQETENASFADGRCAKKGVPSKEPIPQDVIDIVSYQAAANRRGPNGRGRLQTAIRDVRDLLPPEIQPLADSRNKRLIEATRYEVDALSPHFQGPREANRHRCTLTLSNDGVFADDCWIADDFTMPVKVYIPDGDWYKVVQGQTLVGGDFRTLRAHGFAYRPEPQYDSVMIRTLLTKMFDRNGVIPSFLYFEKGIWENSKLIHGGPTATRARRDGSALSTAEMETGLLQFGMKFIHAHSPEAKGRIEHIGCQLQDMMGGLKGYCGREQRYDRPEEEAEHEREVLARRVHPSEYYMSRIEWENTMWALIEKYNSRQQQGEILRGLSPEDGYYTICNPGNPPSGFDASCRWLLAYHRIPVTVGDNGISFRQRGQTFRYYGPETSRWRGHKMIAWFNPELPEVLTVTDRNHNNAFTVELYQKPRALPDADGQYDPVLREELSKARAHSSHQRTRYQILKRKFAPKIRPNLVAPRTVALGQEIERQQSQIQSRRSEQETLQRTAHGLLEGLGLPTDRARKATPEMVEGLREMVALRKEEGL